MRKFLACSVLVFMACSDGMDKQIEAGSHAMYRESLKKIVEDLGEEDREKLDGALLALYWSIPDSLLPVPWEIDHPLNSEARDSAFLAKINGMNPKKVIKAVETRGETLAEWIEKAKDLKKKPLPEVGSDDITGYVGYPKLFLPNAHFVEPLTPNADFRTGWVVGSAHFRDGGWRGVILATDDWGENWNQQYLENMSAHIPGLTDVCFAQNERVGLATGDNGTILKTTDGGAPWRRVDFPSDLMISSISMSQNFVNGMVAGSKWVDFGPPFGEVAFTENGGDTWEVKLQCENVIFERVRVDRGGWRGCAVGWTFGPGPRKNVVYTTANGGDDWSRSTLSVVGQFDEHQCCDVIFDENYGNGWLLLQTWDHSNPDNYLEVWKTVDGGENWEWNSSDTGYFPLRIFAQEGNPNRWIVGDIDLLFSDDYGVTWVRRDFVDTFEEEDEAYADWIFFANLRIGFLLRSQEAAIWKTNDGGDTWARISFGLDGVGYDHDNYFWSY